MECVGEERLQQLWDAAQEEECEACAKMETILSRLRAASTIIRCLPELPGYNGSIFMIDDIEAKRIETDISNCVAELEAKLPTQVDKDAEFEAITRPVIEFINQNYHPHVTVVIDPTSAVLSEGSIAYTTNDYLRD